VNLKRMLGAVAGRYGGKVAIISGDRRLTYANIEEASSRVANALLQMGVKRSDRVAMLLSNSPEFVILFFGIVKIGAIAVLLDPKYKVAELTSLLNDCQPKVLLTGSHCLEPLVPVLPRFQSINHVVNITARASGQFLSYTDLVSANPIQLEEPDPEDIAVIGYTSGPSFDPRGTMLPHRCLVNEAEISAEGFEQTERDIVPLFALPMHHAAGLTVVALTTLGSGGTLVMVPGLSIPALFQAIERERATMLIGVPFVFALLVRQAEDEGVKKYDLSSLRLCASGGAPLPVEVSQRFKQYYGRHIAQFWGLTETTAHITCQAVDGSDPIGSVGKPLRGCEVRVVDETGRELPANRNGELLARGPLMTGYYNNVPATSKVMIDGWLHTGDIGRVDPSGNVFISGRNKDVIIVKGQNIAPSDIERVLLSHPDVAEVAALGVPDETRGEVVGVAVSLKAGGLCSEAEVKRLCLERLANYKVPKQVFFLESLPKTATGQIDKEAIRRQLSIPPIFPDSCRAE
jgi:long-chain acyl-CoA synthetase